MAQIHSLAQEFPYVMDVAIKLKKKKSISEKYVFRKYIFQKFLKTSSVTF